MRIKLYTFVCFIFFFILVSTTITAQNLKLRYGLSSETEGSLSVLDDSGNGYGGTLLNGAKVTTYGNIPVIDLGASNGYVDLGAGAGNLIASLNDFTIMSKVFIPTASVITGNGNFVWTFANSNNIGTDANGCMFFSAKNTRYAISPTHWAAESGIQNGSALAQGVWKTIVYVQKNGSGKLFIDGNLAVSGDISMNPSKLGATKYNYLGRSCYDGDAYLQNAKLADFRIYDGAISSDLIASLSGVKPISSSAELLLQYDFDKVSDQSGKYTGSLVNNASLVRYSNLPVLNLGASNGYFDFGSDFGNVISSLDSFSIATNLYIPNSTDISQNGNFVWSFANSNDIGSLANGNLFFCAITGRYAISKTNYMGETGANSSKALSKGKWIHLAYTQTQGIGKIYIDGTLVASNSVTLSPSVLGKTAYNYLGKSCYAGDVFLKNAQYYKLQVYKGALPESTIQTLCTSLTPLNNALDSLKLVDALSKIVIPNADSITSSLVLAKTVGDGVAVSWTSSNTNVITNDGMLTRPANGSSTVELTLTANLTYNNVKNSKTIKLRVIPVYDDQTCVNIDLNGLKISGNINNLHSSVVLPTTTSQGSKVVWTSNAPEYIDNSGKILQLMPQGGGKKIVTLTATVSKGNASQSKNFELKLGEDEGRSAYLFAYFIGNNQSDEQIRFALSNDGYNYVPLNNGNAVIGSDSISLKKAVRDPHIMRAQDGKTFYMVATDMKSAEGWNSNRGIVMLKSTDLIHWSHSTVNFPTKWSANWANVTRVWAPETIFDPQTGKYIVYFSVYTTDGLVPYDKIYYSYANSDFTDLESEPALLFDKGSAVIDGDIVYNETDGLYHLFYKNEDAGGICQVTSKTITAVASQSPSSQWSAPSATLQQTTDPVEGVGVFKLINSDNWAMMYDCYTTGHYQYCSSNAELNKFVYVQNSYNIGARHGTSISITAEEAKKLITSFPSTDISNTPLGAKHTAIRKNAIKIDNTNKTIYLPVSYGTDLGNFNPMLFASPGVTISPSGEKDFTKGAVTYNFTLNNSTITYQVSASIEANPVLPDFHADPEVLYSEKTGRFYIYSTTDGFAGWSGYYMDIFSSPDLVNWVNEGRAIDFSTSQVPWATGNAWAPAIEEKKGSNNEYRYYFYFSGESSGKKIGVAVSNNPTGPFVDSGKPLISNLPDGVSGGQQIDVDVFTDPKTNKSYIYWGNGYMAVAELNDDMISIKDGTTKVITPAGGTLDNYAYREGTYVFYRNGIYYFLWSVDDTGAANYHVAYGTSSSPTGPITVATQPIVIKQDPQNEIYGTGHNSIVKIPGKDEWYIVYHRINKNYLTSDPGIHREICIDKLTFNTDGSIQQVVPTRKGIEPVLQNASVPTLIEDVDIHENKPESEVIKQEVVNLLGQVIAKDTSNVRTGIYILRSYHKDGSVTVKKVFVKKN